MFFSGVREHYAQIVRIQMCHTFISNELLAVYVVVEFTLIPKTNKSSQTRREWEGYSKYKNVVHNEN